MPTISTAVDATISFQRSPAGGGASQRATTSGWKTMSTTTHMWPDLSFSSFGFGDTRCGIDQLCPCRPSGAVTTLADGFSMSPCTHTLMKTFPVSRSKSDLPAGRCHVFSTKPLSGLSSSLPAGFSGCGPGPRSPPAAAPPPPRAVFSARCSASTCAR